MRRSGILMHISSLPSKYGIGTLGKEAYNFVDFLNKSGQTYWQVLPIGQTSYGDSPYQTFSCYAGNPYFIDLDLLKEDGLLTTEELKSLDIEVRNVDYGWVYNTRYSILRKAFSRFNINSDYKDFLSQNNWWLNDYSLFKQPKYKYEITSTTSGTIKLVKALSIGNASMLLGGGRKSKERCCIN